MSNYFRDTTGLDEIDRGLQKIFEIEDWLIEYEQSGKPAEWSIDCLNVWSLLKTVFASYATEHVLNFRVSPLRQYLRNELQFLTPLPRSPFDLFKGNKHPTETEIKECSTILFVSHKRFFGELTNSLIPLYDFLHEKLVQQSALPVSVVGICSSELTLPSETRFFGAVSRMDTQQGYFVSKHDHQIYKLLAREDVKKWSESVAELLEMRGSVVRRLAGRQIKRALLTAESAKIIIDASNASQVYLDSFGFAEGVGIVHAASQLGVKSIEIQHGMLRKIENDKSGRPSHDYVQKPNKRLEFQDDLFDDQISSMPHINRSFKCYNELSVDYTKWAEYREVFRQQSQKARLEGKVIVIVSQQGFDTMAWLPALIDECSDKIQWWVRLSSVASLNKKTKRVIINNKRCFIVEQESGPAINFCSFADAHVTLFSAMALETIAEGLPTFSMLTAASQFPDFSRLKRLESGKLLTISKPYDLPGWIANLNVVQSGKEQ